MLNLRFAMQLLVIWVWVVGEGTEAREAWVLSCVTMHLHLHLRIGVGEQVRVMHTQLKQRRMGDVKSRACRYSRDPCAEWTPRVRRRPFCGRSTETMSISTTTVPLPLQPQPRVQSNGMGSLSPIT
jgi:hypothetical protein